MRDVVRYRVDSTDGHWSRVTDLRSTEGSFPGLKDAVACLRFTSLELSIYEYDGVEVECPNCGSANVLNRDAGEYDDSGLAFRCRKCPCYLVFIKWPTRAEAEAAGDVAQVKMLDLISARHGLFKRSCLLSAKQLPDVAHNSFILNWDLYEDEKKECYTQIKYVDKVIFTELALWEGGFRYREVAEILKEKYGSRLLDLVPTRAGWLYLGGDSFVALHEAKLARSELFGKTD